MDFFQVIDSELKKVDNFLNESILSDNEFLSNCSAYILKSGGKRLRPALFLLCARGCGFNGNRYLDLACALELIHTATLVHDDVIDEARLRRNKQTLNSKYGNKLAVLLGDYLYSEAVSLIIADNDKTIMEIITSTVSQICAGEVFQTLKANTLLEEAEYLNMVEKKTASFFSACCRIGGLIGNAPLQTIEALASYGLNLGIAFQITDDMLDLIAEEIKVGKSTKNDLLNGKFTLPIIYAAKYSTPAEIEILTNKSNRQEVIKIIEKYGGVEYSQNKVENYIMKAKQNLKELNDNQYKEALIELAEYTLNRIK